MNKTATSNIGHNRPELDPHNLRCSDIGNAEVFADQHEDKLRYCFELGRWFHWDGTVWTPDAEAHLDELAELSVMSFPGEASELMDARTREEFMRWAIRSGSRQRMKAMVEQSRHRLSIDKEKLDHNPMIFNLFTDSVNFTTGTVSSSDPRDYSTKQTQIVFDHLADCPEWYKFLNRIMGDSDELIEYLQKAVGYSLTGKTSEQCFFIAHGSGANGKSVFLNLIRDLAGNYGINIPMDTLMAQKFKSGNSNDLAMMHGARLGTAMEGEVGQRLSEAIIKQLTGGDEITARFLHKEFFQFKPIVKIWMATNHKPQITGDDQAIWRRVHLIPFNVVIPPEERDGDLPEKLRNELPGILNWAIKGAIKWTIEGLKPPEEVLQATNEYRSEMDTFSQFCSEIIQRDVGSNTLKAELKKAYELWCSVEGGEYLKPSGLTQRMKQMGYEEHRTGQGRYWKDISLNNHTLNWDDVEF